MEKMWRDSGLRRYPAFLHNVSWKQRKTEEWKMPIDDIHSLDRDFEYEARLIEAELERVGCAPEMANDDPITKALRAAAMEFLKNIRESRLP